MIRRLTTALMRDPAPGSDAFRGGPLWRRILVGVVTLVLVMIWLYVASRWLT